MHLTKAVPYLFELYFWIPCGFVHLLESKQSQQYTNRQTREGKEERGLEPNISRNHSGHAFPTFSFKRKKPQCRLENKRTHGNMEPQICQFLQRNVCQRATFHLPGLVVLVQFSFIDLYSLYLCFNIYSKLHSNLYQISCTYGRQ